MANPVVPNPAPGTGIPAATVAGGAVSPANTATNLKNAQNAASTSSDQFAQGIRNPDGSYTGSQATNVQPAGQRNADGSFSVNKASGLKNADNSYSFSTSGPGTTGIQNADGTFSSPSAATAVSGQVQADGSAVPYTDGTYQNGQPFKASSDTGTRLKDAHDAASLSSDQFAVPGGAKLSSDQRISLLEKAVFGVDANSAGGSNKASVRNYGAKRVVSDAEVQALSAALTASFAAKYPNVGSHTAPSGSALRSVLSFYPVETAAAEAQARFEEAAGLAGNDYLAFSANPINGNHDTGDYTYDALTYGMPASDFYRSNGLPSGPIDPLQDGETVEMRAKASVAGLTMEQSYAIDPYLRGGPKDANQFIKPKDCGQGYQWNASTKKCEAIPGFFNTVGSFNVTK